ncbi:tRNA-modifying protein YgfZ [Buchnera aphidicola (Periphyllus koelreuteriae)]|uniref:tRNA-modifying protein YgfZ n=1 Tax=Buchnera aphidicola TaxID=9 RepID=UPI0031B818CC
MKKIILKKNKIYSVKKKLFSIFNLNNWNIVKISGKDSKKYLQNQITSNINFLKENKYIFCGHCNYQGRIISTLIIFKKNNNYFYILRKSICDVQIQAMKKYSVFFNVKIKKYNKCYLLGIFKKSSYIQLKKFFKVLPNKKNPVIHKKNITIIFLNFLKKIFLLISFNKNLDFLKNKFIKFNFLNDEKKILFIHIKKNIPIIEKKTSLLFFPQEINLDKFKKSIDFNKGCYIGQENISKIKYKNLNKNILSSLYCRDENSTSSIFSPGNFVYVKIKRSWIKKGILLSSVIINKITYVQVVLNCVFKIHNIYKINNFYFKNLL